jgi:TRAP-type C4-dicarboxylate transport system permease small subunit
MTMLRRLLDGLYFGAGVLAGMFLVAIFVLMLVLSGGRPIGVNLPAGDDFVAWCMAAMAFLALAHTFKAGEMIRVGLLLDKLQPRARHLFELGTLAIGSACIGVFAWYAVRMTYDSWRFNDISQGVVAVPLWIPQLGFCVGLVILFIAFIDELLHVLAGHSPRYEKPKPKTSEEILARIEEGGI